MPDGILPPTETTAPEVAAETGDSRLLRHVRRNLVLWSGGTTLLILVALAAALYLAAAGSLANAGIQQLDTRMALLRGERPNPDDTSGYGFIFGGGGSGTFALILDPSGDPILGPRDQQPPPGLPYKAGVTAAAAAGRDVQTTVVGQTPVRVLTETIEVAQRGTFTIQVVQDRTTEQQTLERDPGRPAGRRRARPRGVVRVRDDLRAPRARPDPRIAVQPAARRCAASASSPRTPATSCARR